MNKMQKQYIEVVEYGPYKNGVSYPKVIKCFGRKFRIDEVLDIEFSLSNEYDGYRYKVKIGDAVKYIYDHNSQWYVLIPDRRKPRV